MLHFLLPRFAMPYRRTANVVRKLAARHDAILAAACEAAAEGGMAAVQIAPVAARAGIATGTVYRYFPSKTELVAARLPGQDAALAAPALLGALVEGLIGSRAPAVPDDPAKARAQVQMLTLFALRALGVVDARARGLVVQTVMPQPSGKS